MDDTPKKPAAFDPARFRMGTPSSKDPVARKVVTLVRVNKAAKQQFVRTRTGDGLQSKRASHRKARQRPRTRPSGIGANQSYWAQITG